MMMMKKLVIRMMMMMIVIITIMFIFIFIITIITVTIICVFNIVTIQHHGKDDDGKRPGNCHNLAFAAVKIEVEDPTAAQSINLAGHWP